MVIDGKTGYVFPSGDVDALADAIVKIGGVSAEEQAAMAKAGKEGLPNVLLEALAMETPCVATHKYGMPEVTLTLTLTITLTLPLALTLGDDALDLHRATERSPRLPGQRANPSPNPNPSPNLNPNRSL